MIMVSDDITHITHSFQRDWFGSREYEKEIMVSQHKARDSIKELERTKEGRVFKARSKNNASLTGPSERMLVNGKKVIRKLDL